MGSILSFYRWGDRGTEKENLPKVTELVISKLVLNLALSISIYSSFYFITILQPCFFFAVFLFLNNFNILAVLSKTLLINIWQLNHLDTLMGICKSLNVLFLITLYILSFILGKENEPGGFKFSTASVLLTDCWGKAQIFYAVFTQFFVQL